MNKALFAAQINKLASHRIPFIFIIDYASHNIIVQPLHEVNPDEMLFNVNGLKNYSEDGHFNAEAKVRFDKFPISMDAYSRQFSIVKNHLKQGNSYLTNLTCATPIKTNLSLKNIFYQSKAPYKLYYNNKFVVFSPEIFVKIKDGKIYSHPMKGTIDASIPDAEKLILANKKEIAEHATIVDLIRNDLSRIARNVKVDKYRYIDRISTNQSDLLQVSSQISGDLPANYQQHLGSLIFELLPAGSISGAPKSKTLEIIKEAETHERGFYTGIFGIFDGKQLDSAVMIRFIENLHGHTVFKSGGGITVNSIMEEEYHEMVSKVYLPI